MNVFPLDSSPVTVARRVARDVTTAHLAALLVASSTLRQLTSDGRPEGATASDERAA